MELESDRRSGVAFNDLDAAEYVCASIVRTPLEEGEGGGEMWE